ncbi:MAG: riboflavin biosynthesis protein RibF [Deltaproteobacteria bacterium]|nr:riboflavin biosynthesis protein RibF [Deltaproteobacteria bacterium]
MQVHSFRPVFFPRPAVLTLGNFDGMHLGHQALARRVAEEAHRLGGVSTLVTFHPHPQNVLGAHPEPQITPLAMRLSLLGPLGLDRAVVIGFSRDMARLTPAEFIEEYLLKRFPLVKLIVGYDFAFGAGRQGTHFRLEELGRRHGFEVEVFPEVRVEGEVVKSTAIRKLLEACRFHEAARLLGRPFSLAAPVARGDGRGSQLGFPTLNQPLEEPLPLQKGVYVTTVRLAGQTYPAVSNYGRRPTVGGHQLVMESHLLDFDRKVYGAMAEVTPHTMLRSEQAFPSLQALAQQIDQDRLQARAWHQAQSR